VKANGAIDDDLANFVFRHFFVPPWLCVSPNSSPAIAKPVISKIIVR